MRSKPAVPIAGKYRLIDIPISNCINSEIYRIAVLTQFNSVSLHRHITADLSSSMPSTPAGSRSGPPSKPSQSADWYQGTADAVRKQLFEIQATGAEYVLILAAIICTAWTTPRWRDFHWDQKADITVAVHPVPREEAGAPRAS